MPGFKHSLTACRCCQPADHADCRCSVIAAWRQSGWNALPKMSHSMDTLSAAALVAKSPNMDSAANPLAAQHFGGTVGQSVLRPGEYAHL